MRAGIAFLAATFAVAGCDRVFGLNDVKVGPTGASTDADDGDGSGSDATAARCFGSGHVAPVCVPADVSIPDFLTMPPDLDTSVDADCTFVSMQLDGPALCVRAARELAVTTSSHIHGARPLVLIGIDQIVVSATLDVSSERATGIAGPGADLMCTTASLDGTDTPANTGGSGGAGGSFIDRGGAGGAGASGGGTSVVEAGVPLTRIRGGCPGGRGGASGIVQGPLGSSGGGAVALLAGTKITLSGLIAAWGAGGGGAYNQAGGGGGGAGGFVALDAPTVQLTATAKIIANGGGGGEGGVVGISPANGGAGEAPAGGTSINPGGDGGDGARGALVATDGLPSTNGSGGGGGGGGGAGYIVLITADPVIDPTATISPPMDR